MVDPVTSPLTVNPEYEILFLKLIQSLLLNKPLVTDEYAVGILIVWTLVLLSILKSLPVFPVIIYWILLVWLLIVVIPELVALIFTE